MSLMKRASLNTTLTEVFEDQESLSITALVLKCPNVDLNDVQELMNDVGTVGTLSELLHSVEKVRSKTNGEWEKLFFRGQGDSRWKLIPSAGRESLSADQEKGLLRAWARHAAGFIDVSSMSRFALLALAQHHGLRTRLLDWTFNPLAAAYFAIESGTNDRDASVICHYSRRSVFEVSEHPQLDPYEIEGIERVRPSSITPRITRQGGIFTIHGPADMELHETSDEQQVFRILIDSSALPSMRIELSHVGVNRMALFPDLDGLSDHLNWVSDELSN